MKYTMTSREVAEYLGVTTKSVQRCEREGLLIPLGRTVTNRRYYSLDQILQFQGRKKTERKCKVIAYCRVSSANQKPDLKNQRTILEEFCVAKGLAQVEFIEEVGGGLNFKRKKFLSLMDEIGLGQVAILIIAHKDRLTRFGYEWFEYYAKQHGCEMLVLNQEQGPPFRLHHASKLSELIIYILKKIDITPVYIVGDLRRKLELVEDFSFVVVKNFSWDDLLQSSFVTNIEIKNKYSAEITIMNTISCKLYQTTSKNLGYALLKLTGSRAHVKNLKGCRKNQLKYTNKTEEEIYEFYNLPFIEPELRENNGEIVAAKRKALPNLIEISNIKGDLHCHTNETDGVLSLEKVVEYAQARGYEYIAITDHSQRLKITNGLDKKRLFKQIVAIEKLNSKLKNFTILKATECGILIDGSLDFPAEVLKELDLVVCSVHSHFRLPKQVQTDRILRAIENPYCTILGHPTGRLINSRLAHDSDVEKILQAAKDNHCVLELNCQPYRLDLNSAYCRVAKTMGIKIAISSDAHSLRGFDFIALGISQARRAWLEASDVINTYSLNNLKKIINLRKPK